MNRHEYKYLIIISLIVLTIANIALAKKSIPVIKNTISNVINKYTPDKTYQNKELTVRTSHRSTPELYIPANVYATRTKKKQDKDFPGNQKSDENTVFFLNNQEAVIEQDEGATIVEVTENTEEEVNGTNIIVGGTPYKQNSSKTDQSSPAFFSPTRNSNMAKRNPVRSDPQNYTDDPDSDNFLPTLPDLNNPDDGDDSSYEYSSVEEFEGIYYEPLPELPELN